MSAIKGTTQGLQLVYEGRCVVNKVLPHSLAMYNRKYQSVLSYLNISACQVAHDFGEFCIKTTEITRLESCSLGGSSQAKSKERIETHIVRAFQNLNNY